MKLNLRADKPLNQKLKTTPMSKKMIAFLIVDFKRCSPSWTTTVWGQITEVQLSFFGSTTLTQR
jgi:hypothetical protein